MTGNATEEYLLTKLDYPGHIDASRLAGLGGSVVGVVSGLIANAYLGAAMGVVLGIILGLVVGSLLYRWLNQQAKAREVLRLTEERARREAETERQIAAMKVGK